ncbi:MAG TPA: VWA domain-containing protein [Pyrinomonadaceae bacterium]|jgi:VWFA-related protein
MMFAVRQQSAATFFVIVAWLLLSGSLRAQAQGDAPSPQAEIKLNALVLDKDGRVLADVRQEDLQLTDNGEPQTILSLEKDTRPLRIALIVDNTGSLRTQFREVIEAVKTIINTKAPTDEIALVRFVDSEQINILQDFTADKSVLLDAVKYLVIDKGQSAVIDAVYLTAFKLATGWTPKTQRAAIVLITDGEDRSSYYKPDDLLKVLRDMGIQVFTVGLPGELDKEGGFVRKSPRALAEELLTKLAERTGGRTLFTKSTKDLPPVIEQLLSSLRTQFLIGYTLNPKPKSGSYRQVKVKLTDATKRDKRVVITRPGYLSPR